VTEVAGALGLVALAVVVGSLVYLHLAPTGLSPVRNAVSQYGITSFRAGYRVATIAFGLAGVALAVGLEKALSGGGIRTVVILLVLFAIARGAISWFPMDAPSATRTQTGQIHGLLAFVAFVGAGVAALRLGNVLSRQDKWHSLAGLSTGLGWAMVACLLGLALVRSSPELSKRFGLIERGFYVSAISWFTVFAAALATNAH
jgi:hypothetical protein